MEIYERKGLWHVKGKGRGYATREEAENSISGWKPWTPPELPLPEVREYASLEEAIIAHSEDELDRFEDDLIAEDVE